MAFNMSRFALPDWRSSTVACWGSSDPGRRLSSTTSQSATCGGSMSWSGHLEMSRILVWGPTHIHTNHLKQFETQPRIGVSSHLDTWSWNGPIVHGVCTILSTCYKSQQSNILGDAINNDKHQLSMSKTCHHCPHLEETRSSTHRTSHQLGVATSSETPGWCESQPKVQQDR